MTTKLVLTKEEILMAVTPYQILTHYLQPFIKKGVDLRNGKCISNPLILPVIQRSGSFNIYCIDGHWRFKDFKTGDKGDCFDLVKQLFKLDFRGCLQKISEDIEKIQQQSNITPEAEIGHNSDNIRYGIIDYRLSLREKFNNAEISYAKSYGFQAETVKKYRMKAADEVALKIRSVKGDERNVILRATNEDPIFVYQIGNNCYKLYRPFNSQYKFTWLGTKPENFVFGYEQLPQSGKAVIITAGEKDVITLASIGYNAMCLNSETSNLSVELAEELKRKFKNVLICYDIDPTGLQQSDRLCKEHGLKRVSLPLQLLRNGGKDVSDYFKLNMGLPEFRRLITNVLDDDDTAAPQQSPSQPIADSPENEGRSLEIEEEEELPIHPPETIVSATEAAINHEALSAIPDNYRSRVVSLLASAFSVDRPIEKPDPKLQIDKQCIGTDGNLIIITGQAKSGKTGAVSGLLAGFIANIDHEDALGFTVKCSEGKAVLHFDTEQSEYDHSQCMVKVLRRAGLSHEPGFFRSNSLRKNSNGEERKNDIRQMANYMSKHCGGIHAIVIDGIADCVNSVNDERECNATVQFCESLAMDFNCLVLLVLHHNPGSDKSRGHLGSQLGRKCEAELSITKDAATENSKIEARFLRNAGVVKDIEFSYDMDLGYHVFGEFKQRESAQDIKIKELEDMAKKLLETNPAQSPIEFRKGIMEIRGCKGAQSYNILRTLKTVGIVTEVDKLIRLAA
jgi:hypothetical protein